MTGVLGPGDRAAAVLRALDRAEDAAAGALRALIAAGAVDWTGPGATGYRDDLATAQAVVRRACDALRGARDSAVDHAVAAREHEAQVTVRWLTGAGVPSLGGLEPPGGPDRLWAGRGVADPAGGAPGRVTGP